LDGRRPDPESTLQHNSLDDDGYNPSTYGATRAAAAGNLYEAANSSHGNLMDLQQQQQETLQSQREAKPTRPVFGGEKPNRSESQGLDDGRPIDLASLLPSNPPGGDASRRAEERVFRSKSKDGQEDEDHEYRRTDYYQPSDRVPARQSSHLDLQDADN
jgi:hypothetical protein